MKLRKIAKKVTKLADKKNLLSFGGKTKAMVINKRLFIIEKIRRKFPSSGIIYKRLFYFFWNIIFIMFGQYFFGIKDSIRIIIEASSNYPRVFLE